MSLSFENASSHCSSGAKRPLIAHVIHRLDYGGMETILVDLINHMGDTPFRHAVVCLKDFSEFRNRLVSDSVDVIALGKREGKDFPHYYRLLAQLRRMRPSIVNTYGMATLDLAPIGRLAGSRLVHSEHGWQESRGDVLKKYIRMRRLMRPFTDRVVAVSSDLHAWLHDTVGIPERKIACIYNGVDANRFGSSEKTAARKRLCIREDAFVVGTVARLAPVKAQADLVEAFSKAIGRVQSNSMVLAIVGDGPERNHLETLIREKNLTEHVIMPGARSDVADWLRAFDVFSLPSRNEGISIAALEAMASGLPVVASNVGGNPEVVVDHQTGRLTPVGDTDALADALVSYAIDDGIARQHGIAGRKRMLDHFSMDAMVAKYLRLYDDVLGS